MNNMTERALLNETRQRFEGLKLTFSILMGSAASAIGFIIVLIYIAVALIDQLDPGLIGLSDINSLSPNFVNTVPQPPSHLHIFGTTYPGIDLFQGILKAIRIDLGFSVFVVVVGALLGVVIGLVSAYHGKWLDEIVMRVTDVFFSIPYLVLAIAIGFFLGRSLLILSVALIIIWWPVYARVVRGQVLSIREQSFVEAAKASGVRNVKIMFSHVLPNTLAPIFVQFSFDLATIVLVLATLDFIGFSPANTYLPELGYLSYIGYGYIAVGDWWAIVFPGITLMIFALSMNLVGDGLRDALDPKLRR